jgi:nucleoside-diphosphate-sugar epimerase
MKVVILNPAMVVGPHDASNWGRLFFALRDGELPGVTRGNMSVGHVREVAKAHLSAVENGRSGERYLLGGENIEFAEFVKLIADISGVHKIPKVIPKPILKMAAYFHTAKSFFTKREPELTPETARMLTRDVVFSSEKAKRELDYKIPPVRESLLDCYNWLKQENLL